jgi:hypothetical protein
VSGVLVLATCGNKVAVEEMRHSDVTQMQRSAMDRCAAAVTGNAAVDH